MSATQTQQPTPATAAAQPTLRDTVIGDARNLPDLINKAQQLDPELAKRLTGTATAASVTAPGVFVSAVVSWVAARYALGWSPEFCSLVSGGVVLVAGYVFHYFRQSASLLSTTAKVPT